MYDTESNWTQNEKGNYVLHEDWGAAKATVYRTPCGERWGIIINSDEGGRCVTEEYCSHDDAMNRAEACLRGVSYKYKVIRQEGPHISQWKRQKTTANGAPTYGRKNGGFSVTVKRAATGKWFYMTYDGPTHSEPFGWYESAEKAMQVFDSRHQKPNAALQALFTD